MGITLYYFASSKRYVVIDNEVLEHVFEDGTNPDNRGISKTFSMRLGSYDFVYILHLMIELLGSTNNCQRFCNLGIKI